MLEEIKKDLADNFKNGDEQVLQDYIDEVTRDALSISNRENTTENIELLSIEIKRCVKSLYLQRGSEGANSLSDSGVSSSFNDAIEQMRNEIVKSGKRVFYL